MMNAETRLTHALTRLEAAYARLESALEAHPDIDGDELARLQKALTVAEQEQATLAAANRLAAEKLDQTIGRLRGLIGV